MAVEFESKRSGAESGRRLTTSLVLCQNTGFGDTGMKIHSSTARLAAGHFFVDCYSSMLGAFLPFLHRELHLTLTQAGLLGGALILTSSFLQPLYGYLSDRLAHRAFAALGPVLAGVFISSLGMATGFDTLLVLVLLGGLGIGIFHPQGTAVASTASAVRPGLQLSFFIAFGMIGYSLGPLYITLVIEWLGLRHSYWAAIPGVVLGGYLLLRGPTPVHVARKGRARGILRGLRLRWKPMSTLFALVVLRSAVQLAMVAFLPLLLTARGASDLAGSQVLTLFLLLGGGAVFLGGTLMDRIGGRAVIILSSLLFVPLLVGFLLTRGPLSVLLCILGGGALLLTLPVNVAMAQRLVPGGAGTVSALMMGFAWGVGGVAVPLVGRISDQVGLETAFLGLLLVSSPSIVLAWLLPSEERMTADMAGPDRLSDEACGGPVDQLTEA